jgi:hypothetical protein
MPKALARFRLRQALSDYIVGWSTSEVGQSRHFGRRPTTSGLPPGTVILRAGRHVSNVPTNGHGDERGPRSQPYQRRHFGQITFWTSRQDGERITWMADRGRLAAQSK